MIYSLCTMESNWMYRNLLQSRTSAIHRPDIFVRELFETAEYDRAHDLSAVRELYRAKLGEDPLKRILAFESTDTDLARAEQVVTHFFDHTRVQVARGLSWSNLLWNFHWRGLGTKVYSMIPWL